MQKQKLLSNILINRIRALVEDLDNQIKLLNKLILI